VGEKLSDAAELFARFLVGVVRTPARAVDHVDFPIDPAFRFPLHNGVDVYGQVSPSDEFCHGALAIGTYKTFFGFPVFRAVVYPQNDKRDVAQPVIDKVRQVVIFPIQA